MMVIGVGDDGHVGSLYPGRGEVTARDRVGDGSRRRCVLGDGSEAGTGRVDAADAM